MALLVLPNQDMYPELDTSPVREMFFISRRPIEHFSVLTFTHRKFCASCEVIYMKFAVASPFKLKFLLCGLPAIPFYAYLLLTLHIIG